jgi:signal transduction histidine kinase
VAKDSIGQGRRFLRAAGISAWIASGVPAVLMVLGLVPEEWGRFALSPGRFAVWAAAATLFGVAFWTTSGLAGRERAPRSAPYLLLAQSAAGLGMFALVCTGLETMLLVVVAAQLGLFVRLPLGLLWVALQTALLAWLGIAHHGLAWSLQWTVLVGLPTQVLALFASYFAASQARARHELARANAELRATREMLAESKQLAERARISRELHDLLGHHLTALSLRLEATRHEAEGPLREELESCQGLTKLLLGDVREAVRSVRGDGRVDVEHLLSALVAEIPQPRIHLEVPEDLTAGDPERARAIVRCVQEIVTNTVRHAQAENLWIQISRTDGRLELVGRDDGQGTRRLRWGQRLTGMRERLAGLGGSLEVDSPPGGGFRVRALIPLPEPEP